ncbi:hypothetical protein GLYMA_08G337600v4 [Glycine max]|nr:hypothetical protein GLYMA_08G337600v4 [Glycine max]KAG4399969.1 hypothetical protein GLYMA_08G337600v4 [Glycine max]KAH1054395.1 hypothetical protein GYH30_023254 [Glycine max]KAH1054396.1 hypothetical protein GYH30_023254 [Glycine max]
MESNQAASSMDVDTVPSEVKLLPPKPKFEPLKPHEMSDGQVQFRKVNVPPHRYTPLKKAWMDIYTPIYEQMKIDVRMNLKGRRIELKTRPDTPDISNLQKCADFAHAFMLGFDVIDAIALLRLDELYIESFEIKDVKTLRGDHLSRAIGRLSGKGGKTKFAIENASKTRIVIADTKIHILGSFSNIKIARDSLCSLILGSPAGKVYSKLRAVTARLAERFSDTLTSYHSQPPLVFSRRRFRRTSLPLALSLPPFSSQYSKNQNSRQPLLQQRRRRRGLVSLLPHLKPYLDAPSRLVSLSPRLIAGSSLVSSGLTMEAIVKKFQSKFRKVREEMSRWDELQSCLISQFRNASHIVDRLQVLQNSNNYGVLNCASGLKDALLVKQIESLRNILVSMRKTLEEFHCIVLSLDKIHRDSRQQVKGGSCHLNMKQLQQQIGIKPSLIYCLDSLMFIHEIYNSEYLLKSSVISALSEIALKPSDSDLGALQQLLVDQPNLQTEEVQFVFDVIFAEELS